MARWVRGLLAWALLAGSVAMMATGCGSSSSGGANGGTCKPSAGAPKSLTFNELVGVSGCAGARLTANVSAPGAGNTFTCCGVIAGESKAAIELSGQMAFGSDRGVMELTLPNEIIDGFYDLDVTCGSGASSAVLELTVNLGTVPVVTGADASVTTGGVLHVQGSGLGSVGVALRRTDGSLLSESCFASGTQSDTSIACDVTATPGEYEIIVGSRCGAAVNRPKLTVVPPA